MQPWPNVHSISRHDSSRETIKTSILYSFVVCVFALLFLRVRLLHEPDGPISLRALIR